MLEMKILAVSFPLPVRVRYEYETEFGEIKTVEAVGGIDLMKRELFIDSPVLDSVMREKVFEFIDNASVLPEESFQADSNIYGHAEKAQKEHDAMQEFGLNLGE